MRQRGAVIFLTSVLFTWSQAFAQHAQPQTRISAAIDESRLVQLRNNVPRFARAQFDAGPAPGSLPARRMLLLLSRTPEQEQSLLKLLDDQQTPGSSNFRKWLTPVEFGQQFGASDADVHTVTQWLAGHGFQVDRVGAGKNIIEFSGTAQQVSQAFHTQIHKFVVGGKEYWSNAGDPRIPEALAPVVSGVASLNNFERRPLARRIPVSEIVANAQSRPNLTFDFQSGYYYGVGPGDFATIYNSTPLIQSGNDGTGQTIAVVADSNINPQDVTSFRSAFGLSNTPDNHTTVVLNGPDPGINPDEIEAVLDAEWAGGVAPGANIAIVVAESTETTGGADLSTFYIINNNLASVISSSFGSGCESAIGAAGNLFYSAMYEQAAAQGITVVVAAGDNGSAGCDDPTSEMVATLGLGVSGNAATPFNVAVGGTDFYYGPSASTWWNTSNSTTTKASAKSYIPEKPWNDSCAASATAANLGVCPTIPSSGAPSPTLQIWAGSGGASSVYNKPAWQTGAGVPQDGHRDIPDVSFFAEPGGSITRAFSLIYESDVPPNYQLPYTDTNGNTMYFVPVGGTSIGAPEFAGVVAMANQKAGGRLGNVNYLLYKIAAQSGATCTNNTSACIFHDTTLGNISVPCQGGTPNCSNKSTVSGATGVLVDSGSKPAYMAGSGYDLATGLGSPNITNLVNALANAGFTQSTTTLALNGGSSQVTATHGAPVAVQVTVSPSQATGDVALLGSNNAGFNAGIDSLTLAGGMANWSTTLLPGGNYNVSARYAGDGTYGASTSAGVPVAISAEPSKTFPNLVTFDVNSGAIASFTGSSTTYGAPYVFRVDVTDANGSVSATNGVSSKCYSHLSSCPTGSVTVTANGSPLDIGTYALNSLGYAEDQPIQLTPGNYNILANYPGDPSYAASTGSSAVTVGKAPTTVTAGIGGTPVQYGVPEQLGAGVNTNSNGVAPTGTITFFDNGTALNQLAVWQQASAYSNVPPYYAWLDGTASYAFPSVGTHNLTAQYSGDQNYAGGASPAYTLTVVQAYTGFNSVSALPNPATPSLPVTLSALVSSSAVLGTMTGTVTFSDNGVPLAGTPAYQPMGSALKAQLNYTFTQTGTHSLTAQYSGDTNFAASTSAPALQLSIANQLPANFVNFFISNTPAGVPTTIFASVANTGVGEPAMTGTLTFTDNGAPISGTITYQYRGDMITGSFGATYTATGSHSIVVQYSGDANYAPAQAQTTFSVVAPFSLGIAPPATNSISLGSAGGSGSLNVNVNVVSGATLTVNVACSTNSTKATCNVNPSSVPFVNGGAVPVAVSYSVPALGASLAPGRRTSPWALAVGFMAVGLLLVPGIRRRPGILVVLLSIALIGCVVACGGSSSSTGGGGGGGPVKQSYVFTVTGTDANNSGISANTTFTVTVQ